MLTDMNLLIVDDDPSTIESVSHLLKRLGATKVSVARSGYEAFAAIASTRERFDCVIADVCMPEGNGLEMLFHIRTSTVAKNFRPDMCVVLMSGLASQTIASTARKLDVNAFLVKPFSVNKLHMAVVSARGRTFPLNQRQYHGIEPEAFKVA